MKTVYDVQQLLKRFGTIIYIGNRIAELEMMEDEVRELYQTGCIETADYQTAVYVLKKEAARLRENGRSQTNE
ncbi:YqgQ family protein [Virgibacillus siamensis]|uniref:YqgQ family protein n=1 Tax=Virgibacillus siamensis TaxID=480071 RepID=UPI0009860870|nr:YqgQ family protein [Virgibacillus siamensis]